MFGCHAFNLAFQAIKVQKIVLDLQSITRQCIIYTVFTQQPVLMYSVHFRSLKGSFPLRKLTCIMGFVSTVLLGEIKISFMCTISKGICYGLFINVFHLQSSKGSKVI